MHKHIVLGWLALLLGLAMASPAAAQGHAKNLHAICAQSPNFEPDDIEASDADIARSAPISRPAAWRCQNGTVLLCYMGASGAACAKAAPYDAARRAEFLRFCRSNPGMDIPNALTAGLQSDWRCMGRNPMLVSRAAMDAQGYKVGSWRAYPAPRGAAGLGGAGVGGAGVGGAGVGGAGAGVSGLQLTRITGTGACRLTLDPGDRQIVGYIVSGGWFAGVNGVKTFFPERGSIFDGNVNVLNTKDRRTAIRFTVVRGISTPRADGDVLAVELRVGAAIKRMQAYRFCDPGD